MIKRLIFDIDGTLITGVSFRKVIIRTLERYGIYSPQNVDLFLYGITQYEKFHHAYLEQSYLTFFGYLLGVTLDHSFLTIFFDELKDVVPSDFSKLKRVIHELSTHYELVILSNFFRESQMNRLQTMGIHHYFQEYYGDTLIKPNYQVYLAACGCHKPEECVMIGDNLYLDIQMASLAGLHSIYIHPGDAPNDYVTLESVEDLSVDLLEQLSNESKFHRN